MKIFLESEVDGIRRVQDRKAKCCVIGVGTIGLPLATFLAKEGFHVIGLDKKHERVEEINNGTCVFEYAKLLNEMIEKKMLHATLDPAYAIKDADIIFVCVPTPVDHEKNMSTKFLLEAVESISKNITRGELLIFESSVSIGTTAQMGKIIEEKSGLNIGEDIGLAYCPERYNPTMPFEKAPLVCYDSEVHRQEHYTLDKVSRVVGASNPKSLALAKEIYSQIIKEKITPMSSMETAEAVKLTENIFRDTNIALMNELSKIYTKLRLDTFEIVNGAKTKPFAFLPHYPSTGVGGECIPVDTWYLIKQAESIGCDTHIMKASRIVNDSMPFETIALLEKALSEAGKDIKDSRICILGLAYKANINDIRLSPSLVLNAELQKRGANIFVCDPLITQNSSSGVNLISLEKAFDGMDAVILSTDHDIFRNLNIEDIKKKMNKNAVLIDGRNFYDEEKAKSLGFIYKGIGKPY